MELLYKKLLEYLKEEDKEKSLALCMDALEKEIVSVVELYEFILTPAINNIIEEHGEDDEDNLIWKEHVRSGIIRTIVENAYPYVLKDRVKTDNIKDEDVIVMCPRFEDHDLGARMISDFFTIAGYNSTFVGANTPERTILKAIESIRPKYLSMSVTNYYNLVAAKKTIDQIKKAFDYKIVFLLGGSAFKNNPDSYREIGGDFLLKTYEDLENFSKGVDKNEITP